jgi:hypothetical protein
MLRLIASVQSALPGWGIPPHAKVAPGKPAELSPGSPAELSPGKPAELSPGLPVAVSATPRAPEVLVSSALPGAGVIPEPEHAAQPVKASSTSAQRTAFFARAVGPDGMCGR